MQQYVCVRSLVTYLYVKENKTTETQTGIGTHTPSFEN